MRKSVGYYKNIVHSLTETLNPIFILKIMCKKKKLSLVTGTSLTGARGVGGVDGSFALTITFHEQAQSNQHCFELSLGVLFFFCILICHTYFYLHWPQLCITISVIILLMFMIVVVH